MEETELVTLVSRAQDGDLACFERLVERFEDRVFRLAYRMVGNRHDAEDIVQETFVGAWEKLEGLRHPEAFPTWLYRLSANRCRDALRRRSACAADSMDGELMDEMIALPAPPGADPERRAEGAASMDALARLLQSLPAEQRLCWVLREMQGLGYRDIAEAAGTSETVVRGRLARARRTLAQGMEGWR
ncbi:sigma-70 family RNA polymerase sigma factor [Rothia sp. AR01]|uniref:Sigma-70 family RNA polymerase sigma factor n=1 Tax=Rothia santali TaxID=2949643 RepID=A0A9X2KHP3_9MICC|nr:sigma-70 family RNA polymerase sigma factor [Rothia santali]MCP3425378.1 sigma-70 family RNA polymerase sigma factor [Rothia santali]